MKRIALAAAFAALPLVASAQTETYALDPYHTIPHFSLEYWGYGTIQGRFDKTSGKFTIDRTAKKAGLEFAIEAASSCSPRMRPT